MSEPAATALVEEDAGGLAPAELGAPSPPAGAPVEAPAAEPGGAPTALEVGEGWLRAAAGWIGRSGWPAVERVGHMAAARIRWDRVGRWALIGVFVLVLYLYIGPARSWFSTYAEAKRKREDVAALRAHHAQLERRVKELSGPGALEREARELGMVKAGERTYVVGDLPK